MTDLWMPGVERADTGRRLTMRGDHGARIFTHHTFEAPYTYSPDCRAAAKYLGAQRSDPHFVFHPITGALIQMLPATTGGRTLRASGASTNTWGQIHIQVEVIAYAANPWTDDLTAAGRETLARLLDYLRSWGIPDTWCHGIRPPTYPGPGVTKRQPTISGHFHHAGWVVNNHGDPGRIADPWVAAQGETVPTPLPAYPRKADLGKAQFWRDLEAVVRSEGFDVYCGRSHYDSGACRPGKHGHGAGSLHFEGLALDFGRDSGGAAVSTREKIYVSAKIRMLRDYYGAQMGWVHDRGPGDHEDHGHVQARPNRTNGRLWDNSLAGVTMYGDRGAAVSSWQDGLKATGQSVTVDGVYGLETFWATRAWQSSRGLAADGIIGAGSQTEMARHLAQIAAGDISDGVDDLTEFAEALAALGYPATVAGVTAFQQDRTGAPHHLDPDGKFGPLTRAALEADMATIVTEIKEHIDRLRRERTNAHVKEMAKMEGILAAVEKIGAAVGMTPEQVRAVVDERIESVELTLTVPEEG